MKTTTIVLYKNENQNNMYGNVQHMTSLEIAELTGKQHFHVMEAIRKMEPAWKKIAASNFRLGTYKDSTDNFAPITRCQARCDTLIVNLQQTMTSLEIAELTGKQHKDVMRAIRKMEPAWVKVNGRNFALVEYKDAKGELRPITRCQARCDMAM